MSGINQGTLFQAPFEYETTAKQLNKVINKYEQNFSNKYVKMEVALIDQLQKKAEQLKLSITQLKKATSNEELQLQINDRKQQKQSQRIKLEMKWRQVTDKLKKMQKQEKQIHDWNRQAEFDVQNLQEKIEELRIANIQLRENVRNLKGQKNSEIFVTDTQNRYISPYSFKNRTKKQNNGIFKTQENKKQQSQQNGISKALYSFLNRKDIRKKLFYILRQ